MFSCLYELRSGYAAPCRRKLRFRIGSPCVAADRGGLFYFSRILTGVYGLGFYVCISPAPPMSCALQPFPDLGRRSCLVMYITHPDNPDIPDTPLFCLDATKNVWQGIHLTRHSFATVSGKYWGKHRNITARQTRIPLVLQVSCTHHAIYI